MSRASLPVGHLRRIAELLASHGEEKAAAWLLGALEAQECPSQGIRNKVNTLRPEWGVFAAFDAGEEHHFRANEPDLRDLRPEDWELMRDYLAYTPREGESFFQVQKRGTFLQAPEDTLGAAIKWQKTHRRKPYSPPAKKHASPHQDAEIGAMLTEFFKEVHLSLDSIE